MLRRQSHLTGKTNHLILLLERCFAFQYVCYHPPNAHHKARISCLIHFTRRLKIAFSCRASFQGKKAKYSNQGFVYLWPCFSHLFFVIRKTLICFSVFLIRIFQPINPLIDVLKNRNLLSIDCFYQTGRPVQFSHNALIMHFKYSAPWRQD